MKEGQQLIEQIQSVLAWEHDPDQEFMESLAADYTRLVTSVNDRLRQCDELLSRGLRAEAIQQAEAEPNLLDLTAVLDFPEAEYWTDYVSQYELPPLPELQLTIASDLNDAYAAEQPLSRLLQLHRLHALALSPLPMRIAILRELARADRDNPLWEEDLKSYEEARHRQIEADLEEILQTRDIAAAAELDAELSAPGWLARPPRHLVSKTRTLHKRLKAYEARKEMRGLATELADAFAQQDLAAGERVSARWYALAELSELPPDDELVQIAGPALDWIGTHQREQAHQNAYANALEALQRAVDSEASQTEIDRRVVAVQKFTDGVPDDLMQRMQDRESAILRQAGRKKLLIGLGVLGVLAAIGGGVFYQMSKWEFQDQVLRSRQNLRMLLEDGKIVEARDFYGSLDPSMVTLPEIASLKSQMDQKLADEQDRRSVFEERLQRAGGDGALLTSWAGLESAVNAADLAEELAANDAEHREIATARQKIEDARARLQQSVDNDFINQLSDLKQRVRQRPMGNLQFLEGLLDDLGRLRRMDHVTQDLKVEADDLRIQLRKEGDQLRVRMQVEKKLEEITGAVGNLAQYQRLLGAFRNEFSGNRRAIAVGQVMNRESRWWSGPGLWLPLRERMVAAAAELTSDSAGQLLSEYQQFQQAASGFPATTAMTDWAAALRAMAARQPSSGEPLWQSLRPSLSYYLDLPLVVAGENGWYYTDSDQLPRISGGEVIVVPFTDTELNRGGSVRVPVAQLQNGFENGGYDWNAPHTAFARQAMKALSTADANWEETFGQQMQALFEAELIDPVVKVKLLLSMGEVASQGSTFLAQALEKNQQLLNGMSDPDPNWVSPDDSSGAAARQNAVAILRRLTPPGEAAKQAVQARTRLLENGPGPAWKWVGWLHRDLSEVWTCSFPETPAAGDTGVLVVLVPGADDDTADFTAVGSLDAGQLVLDADGENEELQEGRPVFLVVE